MTQDKPDIMITAETLSDNIETFAAFAIIVTDLLTDLASIPPEDRNPSWALSYIFKLGERPVTDPVQQPSQMSLDYMLGRIRDNL